MTSALTFAQTITAFGLLFLLSACAPPGTPRVIYRDAERTDTNEGPQRIHIEHGSPQVLIEGAEFNRTLPFTRENFQEFNQYELKSWSQWQTRSEQFEPTTTTQRPPTEDRRSVRANPYRFETEGNQFTYAQVEAAQEERFEISFVEREEGGALEFEGASYFLETRRQYPEAEFLHFSMKPDRSAFSLLIRGTAPEGHEPYFNPGEYLMELVFVAPVTEGERNPLGRVESEYRYLRGSGVRVRWNQRPEVPKLCGSTPALSERLPFVQYAFRQWQPSLPPEMRIDVQDITVDTSPAPFSDLNQNCVHFARDYILSQNTLAVTLVKSDPYRQRLIGGDIIYFESIFEPLSGISYQDSIIPTTLEQSATQLSTVYVGGLVHEVGHFYGLAHQFDRTIPSVMGYERHNSTVNPSEYDRRAIEALYR